MLGDHEGEDLATAMVTRQRIIRSRRKYNQWVANQTLEDYALRFTAKSARRWSALRVANTALGGISFLALEAIGGTITIGYGFATAVTAILLVGLLIFAAGLPISYYCARDGVDIDLLTRGAGFGYLGSTITSLIYATFTFVFFAIEASILASVLRSCLGIPLGIGYVVCSLSIIPLAMRGITVISQIQLWSQPIWLVLQILPFMAIALAAPQMFAQWPSYLGLAPGSDGSVHLAQLGAAGSVVFALMAQIGEQADYLRFLPPRQARERNVRWWAALLSGGPGWIVIGVMKLLAGSFLAYLAVATGVAPQVAVHPEEMYRVAFGYVANSPMIAAGLAAIFVVVSQVKINITNAYAGSLAWSNFFSRLTHRHPGRIVWLAFNVVIALLLTELGIYRVIAHALVIYSIIVAGWIGALVADLVINKPLGLSPAYIEFKRAHLYAINPVGMGAMVLAVSFGLMAYGGMFGTLARAFAPFLGLFAALVAAPLIAWATRGRYYLVRRGRARWEKLSTMRCVICGNDFEPEDMAFCPVYSGAICSLCCSLDSRCADGCKSGVRLPEWLPAPVQAFFHMVPNEQAPATVARFVMLLGLFAGALGLTLAGTYSSMTLPLVVDRPAALASAFWTAFFILLALASVLAWLLALAQESQLAAVQETRRQTRSLFNEIDAHRRTDARLKKAKQEAEAANLAKSRFVVGINHELRSPLNAILGYAQLLERNAALPPHVREDIGVIRRSGEHLAGLIEGLLDISKIEAGRIQVDHSPVRLREFLSQLVEMFRVQAAEKGISFAFVCPDYIPAVVYTDERRLRQILINLISNAVKFTWRGEVRLCARWRSEIAEFEINDTGVGIAEADIERIFEPFERVERTDVPAVPGAGLGLTITRLLTQILGGELTVASTPSVGTCFRVRLTLTQAPDSAMMPAPERRVTGYRGRRLTVLIADDDQVHRGLMEDLMSSLGFVHFTASSGEECMATAVQCQPDLLLLDISMPGMNGWLVAERLRQMGFNRLKIIVISAHAAELGRPCGGVSYHDDYIVKPVNLSDLLARVGKAMHIEWNSEISEGTASTQTNVTGEEVRLDRQQVNQLRQLLSIGYLSGIRAMLEMIEGQDPAKAASVARLRRLAADFQLEQLRKALEAEVETE